MYHTLFWPNLADGVLPVAGSGQKFVDCCQFSLSNWPFGVHNADNLSKKWDLVPKTSALAVVMLP